MARKSEPMTARQRQSQQIMRQKASRKKRRALMRKLAIVGGSLCCMVLVAGSVWVWKSGAIGRTAQATVDKAYAMTVRAGFSVQALYLEGRNRTSMEDIEKAMAVKKGDPILRLTLSDIRERLEKIESIKFAAVERELPGTLHVRIVEREPVAMWQHQGKMALVDDNGVVMTGLDIGPYSKLPLIIGDDAPKHVTELLSLLTAEPGLSKRFIAAIYVGERRWNIRLKGNIEVKLPESNPLEAWKKLADLANRQQLLERNIKEIDLRLEGKMFIKLIPEQAPGKAVNARET